jgi:hypothetical protein
LKLLKKADLEEIGKDGFRTYEEYRSGGHFRDVKEEEENMGSME